MRDITLEDTFRHQFTTRQFSDGVPTLLAGTPVLSVLEENNVTPITAGVSVSVDRATVAGLNEATIIATAANGYETGKSYAIYISTGTVGGVSVIGEVVGHFTIDKIPKSVWDRVLSGALHNIVNSSGRRLRQLQEAGGYIGAIWIDTVDGTAGTTNFENGTDTKPSLTIADANTLAAALNIERFQVAPGSSLTFAAAQSNQGFDGDGWTLALGGQSIAGSTFRGADVSGIGIGEPHEFHDCHFGVCTLGGGEFKNCGLEDTITLSGAVVYSFIDCYHNESGAASTIDFNAGGATEVHIHNWHGNLTILNMGAGDILHFTSADGSLTMDASCTAGTRNSAGTFGLTDNSSGMTINDLGQAYQRIGAPVGADISADIAAVQGDTDDIQTRLPAALVGARMDSDIRAINGSTVAAIQLALSAAEIEDGAFEGTPTVTTLQTDLAETQDDIYIGRIIIITSGAARGEATDITDYTGSSGTLEVTALANAPVATDTFILI